VQNRYVGDIGDFAKYGLLRQLLTASDLRLGIVWYLFQNETHNSDGRHIGYLRKQVFSSLDPHLHQVLEKLVSTGTRSVKAVAKSGIFPKTTIYFDAPISGSFHRQSSRQVRELQRSAWLQKAIAATANCDLIFFDPDNGLETPSVGRYSPKGGKYVFWDELSSFWESGQSLLVYHHLNRTASVVKQTEILQEKFAAKFPDAGLIRHFLFRRGSCRHFWLIAQDRHTPYYQTAVERIFHSDWREYLFAG
jgi:hypothetical protein